MMAAVLGGPNVYPLKSQTLSSPYNDWAQGHLLIFIEELRLVGHNRYDVLNSIKDNITNDVVEINPKFVNPYSAPNNSAYLATTNFKNGNCSRAGHGMTAAGCAAITSWMARRADFPWSRP